MAFPTPNSSILLCNPTISHDSLHSLPHRCCFPKPLDRVHGYGDATSSKTPIARLPKERTPQSYTPPRSKASPTRASIEPKAPPPSPNIGLIQRWQSSKQRKTLTAAAAYDADAAFFQPLLSDPIESQLIIPQGSPSSTSSSSSRDYTFDTFVGQTTPIPSALAKETGPWPLRDSSRANLKTHRKAQSLPMQNFDPQTPCGRKSQPAQNKSLDLNICLDSSPPIPSKPCPRPAVVSPLQSSPPIYRKPVALPASSPPTLTRKPSPHSTRSKPRSPTTLTPLRLFPTSPTSTTISARAIQCPYYIGPDQISPISSTFRPSLYLTTPHPQMMSVFEDDDEKMGLMDYVRLPLKTAGKTRMRLRRKKSSERNRIAKLRKAFCGLCCGEDLDED